VFAHLQLSSKLVLAFAVVLLLTAATGGVALFKLAQVNGNLEEIATNEPAYAADVPKRIAGGDLLIAVDIKPNDKSSMQASSLEETASSMEELTGTVKQNAENAGRRLWIRECHTRRDLRV
jgi:hypothetical protein